MPAIIGRGRATTGIVDSLFGMMIIVVAVIVVMPIIAMVIMITAGDMFVSDMAVMIVMITIMLPIMRYPSRYTL